MKPNSLLRALGLAAGITAAALCLGGPAPARCEAMDAVTISEAITRARGAAERRDYAEALQWYRKAAEQDDAQAQYIVGVYYDTGQGVARDHAEAARWFHRAADQGYAQAQYTIGIDHLSKDYAEALRWFRKAADQGHAQAEWRIGVLYENGQGVEQDYAEAMQWYRRAAAHDPVDPDAATGSIIAQYYIGNLYDKGRGVSRDVEQARVWMKKAAAGGSDPAAKWLAAH